jgi:hypothetical protein
MKPYKRIILGAALFGALGPLLAALLFSSALSLLELLAHEAERSVAQRMAEWIPVSTFVAALAYYTGLVPAILSGVLLALAAPRLRRSRFVALAVPLTCVVSFLYGAGVFFLELGVIAACLAVLPAIVLSWGLHRLITAPPRRAGLPR